MKVGPIVQGLLSILGVFFALGFVIVNARLNAYGVTDRTPFSASYVASGVLFSAFIGGLVIARMVIDGEGRRGRGRMLRVPRFLRLTGAFVVALTSLILVELSVYAAVTYPSLPSLIEAALVTAVWNGVAFGAVAALPVTFERRHPRLVLPTRAASQRTLRFAIAVPLMAIALSTYAGSVYRAIPTWLGGGLAARAELTLADGVCPECQGEVAIIAESSDRLIVALIASPSLRAVEIPLSSVKAIRHRR